MPSFSARARGFVNRLLRPAAPRHPVYMGDRTLFARLANGLWIYLDSDDVSLTPSIITSGEWEPFISRLFQREVQPGMRVVDIGANCGYYALLAAQATTRIGQVIAIEANPRFAVLMRKTFAVNGCSPWVRVVCGAVFDQRQEIELGYPRGYLGSTSILVRPENQTDTVELFKAQAAPLADFLNGDLCVDIVKIDAEGSEPMIWRGAQPVLDANPNITVFMEFSPPMISATCPPAEFLASIRGAGFLVAEVTPDSIICHTDDSALLAKDWAELRLRRPSADA